MTKQDRFQTKFVPEPNSGCWLWTGGSFSERYGRIKIDGADLLAHRVAWELYRGEIPEGLCVLHRCDTPFCINPNHLWLGTHKDNHLDMVTKGREVYVNGERHGRRKLTADQVKQIRESISRKIRGTQRALARKFGVTDSNIAFIKNNRTWRLS